MENTIKRNLLIYAIISAISFTYLILPENAGISVPLFIILQFACLFYIAPNKKPLWMFIPIFILSLNSCISGNSMWRVSNFIVILLLYSVMILKMIDRFNIKDVSLKFIYSTLENIFMPIKHISLPFKWLGEIDEDKAKTVKRIFIGIGISVPFVMFILIMLSSADTVFAKGFSNLFEFVWNLINFNFIFKAIYGILVGLYLFGMIYIVFVERKETKPLKLKRINGDLLIINILLFLILTIYTMFVIIQFKYLFAGRQLPYGLNFTEYARKGFFELLFLSGLNILLILITVSLTNYDKSVWGKTTKFLCCYLCMVTIIMLSSSFYRMWLYSSDDGLTRLRLLVFGFLVFESIGLIITFFYIIKPKFNIAAVYLTIALVYYLTLNVVPIDSIIAKNQIDRYFSKGKSGIDYTITLSTDAAPQLMRLITNDSTDSELKEKARRYFDNIDKYNYSFVPRWQRFNFSIFDAQELSRVVSLENNND